VKNLSQYKLPTVDGKVRSIQGGKLEGIQQTRREKENSGSEEDGRNGVRLFHQAGVYFLGW